MFPPSVLAQHCPIYRRLLNESRTIDLKINQLVHRRIDPDDGSIVTDEKIYHEKLQALRIERTRNSNEIASQRSRVERQVMIFGSFKR